MTQDQQNQKLNQIITNNINLNGRRVIGAGTSVDSGDYVTKAEVQKLIDRIAVLEKKAGIN